MTTYSWGNWLVALVCLLGVHMQPAAFAQSAGSRAPAVQVGPPKLPPLDPKETYFRFKVNLLYRGAPLQFDIVGACSAVSISETLPNEILRTSVTPYVYGRKMSDGQGVVVYVGGAADCRLVKGIRDKDPKYTQYGDAYRDYFPLVAVYPNGDEPREGWLYATEDAYASPLSDLKYIDSALSPATMEEFQAWREVDGPNNIIKESMVDVYGGRVGVRIGGNMGPGTVRFGSWCSSVKRIAIPDHMRERVRGLWPAERPRYWMLPQHLPADLATHRWQIKQEIGLTRVDDILVIILGRSRLRAGGGLLPGADKNRAIDLYPTVWRTGFNALFQFEREGKMELMWERRDIPERVQSSIYGSGPGKLWGLASKRWLVPPPPMWDIQIVEQRLGFAHCMDFDPQGGKEPYINPSVDDRLLPPGTINGEAIGQAAPPAGAFNYLGDVFFERDEFIFYEGPIYTFRDSGGGLK